MFMQVKTGFFKGRLNSVRYAFKGWQSLFQSEPNAKIHLIATVGVIVTGLQVGISRAEWMAICIVTGLVWMAELFNTSVEKAMDSIKPEWEPRIGEVKDLAAGAVLLAACLALVVGCLVFIPYLF
jgi:diacylglycerol kinase (ATP)